MVFLTVEMKDKVAVPPDQLDSRGLILRKTAILHLLDLIARRKATKEHGYYVAVSTVESMGAGQVDDLTGSVVFPITYNCITVTPCRGDILIGTIDWVMKHGIRLKSGPMENVFLSVKMMEDFRYTVHEEPMFVHEHQQTKMAKGAMVRFRVFAVKWIEADREFHMLATIAGDYLGPL